jgi:apolipoprotein N-acyltransferase
MIWSRKRVTLPPEPPNERRLRRSRFRVRLSLSVLSGIMLGFAFPPSHLGILACFGLVPLLIVLADLEDFGSALRYSYAAMLVFHAITLAWTGGFSHGNDPYMMIAGTVTIIVHPFFYFLPLGAYFWLKQSLGPKAALWSFPILWLAYEYSHTLTEWSFPWLTLGNTQTYDLARMQIASFTGMWGLSLWILLLNVLAFLLYSSLASDRRLLGGHRAWITAAFLVLLFILPRVYGEQVLSQPEASTPPDTSRTLRVGIIQSNVDPWDKWSSGGSGYETIRGYLTATAAMVHGTVRPPQLVLWPETAIPYFVLTERNELLRNEIRGAIDALGVSVLTGLPQAIFYADSTKAPASAKRDRITGQRYDSFNAAALFQPGASDIPWYGKMKMVPFAERVPYADLFAFADFLRWNVGIGGWQIGRDTTLFVHKGTGARFSTVICYESVYPDFVAAFVRKGAEFLTIITIDSWWGKMSGAYQHQQFALLRAIENRRWIARCAVGGISCFIDPFGRTYEKTQLFTKASIIHDVERSSDLTFYTRHGDWLPSIAVVFTAMMLAAGIGRRFLQKKRDALWQQT